MSYARRVPNVSQYLANLNTIPTAEELAAQQNESLIGDEGLDFLTNAEFFDFDTYDPLNDFSQQPPPTGAPAPASQSKTQTAGHSKPSGSSGAIAGMGGYLTEFQTYPVASTSSSPSALASPPGLQGAYPPQPQFPAVGSKRSATAAALPSAADLEEQARLAAEEDKRRRNTAASARFRVKKKQREQALEKQAKEMAEKVQMLEGKVQALEMENKWLKSLITEKKGYGSAEPKTEAEEKEGDARSKEQHTDGVGTSEDTVEVSA